MKEVTHPTDTTRPNETTTNMDDRERHIRALCFLMTYKGTPSGACEEFLQHGEYGLALAVLVDDVNAQ